MADVECWLARLFGNVVNACEYHARSDWSSGWKASSMIFVDADGRAVREIPACIDGEG